MSLPGLDRWLTTDPRQADAEGNYAAPPCDGSFNRRVQPKDLAWELDRLRRTLENALVTARAGKPALTEHGIEHALAAVARVTAECERMPEALDVECDHEGDVDASFYGFGSAYTAAWECPVCGKDREDEREVGDDHPDL